MLNICSYLNKYFWIYVLVKILTLPPLKKCLGTPPPIELKNISTRAWKSYRRPDQRTVYSWNFFAKAVMLTYRKTHTKSACLTDGRRRRCNDVLHYTLDSRQLFVLRGRLARAPPRGSVFQFNFPKNSFAAAPSDGIMLWSHVTIEK